MTAFNRMPSVVNPASVTPVGRVLSVSLLKKACKRIKVAANVRFRTAEFIRPGRHADECLVPLLP